MTATIKRNWRTRYPIESFDPRYRKVWLEAALKEIVIPFPSNKEAAAFQARIQMYRAKLRDLNDPDYTKMYRATTSRKGNVLRIFPVDARHEAILSGLTTRDAPVEPAPAVPAAPDLLDEILGAIKEEDSNDHE